MEEKQFDYLKDTCVAIAKMRMQYDEMDEKIIYEKGVAHGIEKSRISGYAKGFALGFAEGMKRGIIIGKILILKDILNLKFKLTETDEEVLESLTEDEIDQIVKVLYTIHTQEDFHMQINNLSLIDKIETLSMRERIDE